MRQGKTYGAEFALVGATMLVGALGFWGIFVGAEADPQPHHVLHLVTTYLWMGLLIAQLVQLRRGAYTQHRRYGLAVLALGPVLVASAALLTVHSAQRAIETGQEDALLVANILGTIWLGLVLWLAFALKRRRAVHGALLTSTMILFLGPALFFTLIAWVPQFRIEGPETFYRFAYAGMTGQAILLVTVLALFLKDRRNNWPYLLAGASYVLAEAIKAILAPLELTDPLTRLTAAPSEAGAFAVTLALMTALLAMMVLPSRRKGPAGSAVETSAKPG